MYVGYERAPSDAAVRTVADLTIPANATHAELQADTRNIRYTMDDNTDPNAAIGLLLVAAEVPKTFLIEDVRRIRWFSAGNAFLHLHYFAGRDV